MSNNLLDVRNVVPTADIIKNICDSIMEGRIDPVEAAVILKRMSKTAEEVYKNPQVKQTIENAFDKYFSGTKTVEVFGARVVKCPVYTSYDYSECGHPQLDEINKIIEQLLHEKERIENELKLLIPLSEYKAGQTPGFGIPSDNKDVIIPKMPKLDWIDDGEVVNVKAPKKVQKIGLKYMKI